MSASITLPSTVRAITCESIDEWRRERVMTIGGSDLGRLLGINGTPLDVYADKVMAMDAIDAGLPLPDEPVNEQMELGTVFEPGICEVFGKRTGLQVVAPPPFTLYRNERFPRLHASPDRFLLSPDRVTPGVLEAKSTGGVHLKDWEAEDGEDDAPLKAQVQIQSYLLVFETSWGWISGLIGTFGWSLKLKQVEAEPTFQEAVLEKVESFFRDHLKPRVPPAPSAPSDADAVKRMFRRASEGVVVSLPAEMVQDANELEAFRAAARANDDAANQVAARIQIAMGDAEIGQLADGRHISWKNEDAFHKAKPAHTVQKRVLRVLKVAKAPKAGAPR